MPKTLQQICRYFSNHNDVKQAATLSLPLPLPPLTLLPPFPALLLPPPPPLALVPPFPALLLLCPASLLPLPCPNTFFCGGGATGRAGIGAPIGNAFDEELAELRAYEQCVPATPQPSPTKYLPKTSPHQCLKQYKRKP